MKGPADGFRHMLAGYCRTSTADQHSDHQAEALLRHGGERDNSHVDAAGGAKASRPELDLVMQLLREGNALRVTRLDRLSRPVPHAVTLGAKLTHPRVLGVQHRPRTPRSDQRPVDALCSAA
ncbi:recombinase family protein [Streptomyces sp. NPDC048411]|uniref:recombinase family protein n=1 Tax=Streptomyces sp. NPDC048411 TaxID=3157206 RepID=UPI0034572455